MFLRLKNWLKRREEEYNRQQKARLCAPCNDPCGRELCRKVGCLNMDMRTNAARLQLLVKRLELYGYQFPRKIEIHEDSETQIPVNTNIVQLNDFRKDDEPTDH